MMCFACLHILSISYVGKKKNNSNACLRKIGNDSDIGRNQTYEFVSVLVLPSTVSHFPFYVCVWWLIAISLMNCLYSQHFIEFQDFQDNFICVTVMPVMAVEGQKEVNYDFYFYFYNLTKLVHCYCSFLCSMHHCTKLDAESVCNTVHTSV